MACKYRQLRGYGLAIKRHIYGFEEKAYRSPSPLAQADHTVSYKNAAATAPNPTSAGMTVLTGAAAPVKVDRGTEAVGVATEPLTPLPCVAFNFSSPAVTTT
ncbi:hypothetical protein HBH89_084010 [Parastagonospora nodorum]|nr:hypothetical protein HBH93_118080 [Parastagonospora nodorum]KAH4447167.1 hypothetical protein HBH91_138240 [Parastagonospora nodorum]KAH4505324.1 hypothetical protein HBH89_084010 [Parastagonospora nodorum]KAH4528186.1 hypothetical protein HBH85_208950 [Parastagonospora nodorum]KAH4547510.1 hypothetical protein HBH86_134630 [Parastagonospora nodorum]